MKSEAIRPKTPLSLADAQRIVAEYAAHYNEQRLHSAMGYITPKDKLEGRTELIYAKSARENIPAYVLKAIKEEIEDADDRERSTGTRC
ncbi:MAG: integrase core domain-containing protein [Gammaproteobacteria bacterium]